MLKFTPGPWIAEKVQNDWFVREAPGGWGRGLARTASIFGPRGNEDEQEANATLMALAPEMYDLLLRFLFEYEGCVPRVGAGFVSPLATGPVMEQARALLARLEPAER
jgi:hypothetical protein